MIVSVGGAVSQFLTHCLADEFGNRGFPPRGFAFQIGRLVLGPPRDPTDRRVPLSERFDLSMATAIVAAILAIASAFYLPASMLALIQAATQVVWGGA